MIFYRVFEWNGKSKSDAAGGPLFIPRNKQGAGRFDLPSLDGVLYASQNPLGAVAETLQGFRSRSISNRHFQRPDGLKKAIVTIEVSDQAKLVDLDDPMILSKLGIHPSQVITHDREVTHPIANRLHESGADGLLWPSSIEGSWSNGSLFQSRISGKLKIQSDIQLLTTNLKIVEQAAAWLSISLK